MIQYISIAIKTTGPDHTAHQLIEFAAVCDNDYGKDIDELPIFHTYLLYENYICDPTYMANGLGDIISQISRDDKIHSKLPARSFYDNFLLWLQTQTDYMDTRRLTVATPEYRHMRTFLGHVLSMDQIEWADFYIDPRVFLIDMESDDRVESWEAYRRAAGLGPSAAALDEAFSTIEIIREHKLRG